MKHGDETINAMLWLTWRSTWATPVPEVMTYELMNKYQLQFAGSAVSWIPAMTQSWW